MDERSDFIEMLIEDHSEAENMFSTIEHLNGQPRTPEKLDELRERTNTLILKLVKHSVAEEECLYPMVRERLVNGDEIADTEIAEHALAEETMKQLDGLSPSNLDYAKTVRTLAGQIREHVGTEEARLLPALGGELSQEERLRLGAQLERAKSMAPTHPHPSAPDRPPANKLLGPGVAIVDRVRDLLAGRRG
jgi:hemerythrin-like domain-containing protein